MRISRRGNSLAARLPASVAKMLGLKEVMREGDEIEIRVGGGAYAGDQENLRSPGASRSPAKNTVDGYLRISSSIALRAMNGVRLLSM